jgi:hypothetical protein
VKTLEQKTVTNMEAAATLLSNHFFSAGKPLGFSWSDGSQVTMKGSSFVPAPLYWCRLTANVGRGRFPTRQGERVTRAARSFTVIFGGVKIMWLRNAFIKRETDFVRLILWLLA